MKKLIILLALFCCINLIGQKSKIDLIQFPDYPSYKSIVTQFFSKYKEPETIFPNVLTFAKKPDGWHAMIVQRWPEFKEIKDELFWTRSFNAFLDINFEKLDEVILKPIIPGNIIEKEDSLMFEILPFWGYVGWEEDIINEYKNLPNLSDNLLNALARAYSSYSTNLLDNNSGFSDPTTRFKLIAGQDALNNEQIEAYKDSEHKALGIYKKLRIQNSSYETFIGNINIVYSNEMMNSFLTLRYYQNNTEARSEIKAKLYDPFILSMARNYLSSCDSNAILFSNGDLDFYPLLYVQETEGFRQDILVVSTSLLNSERYVSHLFQSIGKADPLPVCVIKEIYRNGKKDIIYILKNDSIQTNYDLNTLIRNVESTDLTKKFHGRHGYLDYFPGSNVTLKVKKSNVLDYKILDKYMTDSIVPIMTWNIGKDKKSLLIGEFIMLDVLSCVDFTRPLYFAYGTVPESFLGLQKYLQCDGLAYKIIPVATNVVSKDVGRINTSILYNKLMHDFSFGKIESGSGYRLSSIQNNQIYIYRNLFSRLAEGLIMENKKNDAKKVLDYCDQQFPSSITKYNSLSISTIECYYKVGAYSKANNIARDMFENYSAEIDKMLLVDKPQKDLANIQLSLNVLYELSRLTNIIYPQAKFGRMILDRYSELYRKLNSISSKINIQ